MKRLLASTAAALLVPVAVALPGAASAAPLPAGCGDLDPTDAAAVVARAATSDDTFVGTVVAVGAPAASATPSSPAASAAPADPAGSPVVHTVDVVATLAGDVAEGARIQVELTRPVSNPTLEPTQLSVNGRYLFWTLDGADGDTTLLADGCEGWTSAASLDDGVVATLRQEISAAQEEGAEVALEVPVGGTDAAPELGRLLAPGGAAVLVGVLGLALVSRLGRRR